MNYFDAESKSKIIYLKMFVQDRIIELEGLLNDVEVDVTARTYGKLKREMIAKSDEIAAAGQKNLLANGDKRVSRGMHLVLRKR
jgi:hypothetical protein